MKSKIIITLCTVAVALVGILIGGYIYFKNNKETPVPEPEAKVCAINYQLKGGVNNEKNIESLNEGETLTLSAPTRTAYKFEGWYKDSAYNIKAEDTIAYQETDITLYAKWSVDPSSYGNLPLIEIKTETGALPTTKTDYVNCSFKLSNTNGGEHDLEIAMADSYGDDNCVGIRLRGNSTMVAPKKPFRIKFDKKQKLLGEAQNKSWVLLADYLDQSAIRNYTAFSLAEAISSGAFVPSTNHVVVIINGEYHGLYLLTDQIDENEGRTAVETDIDPSTDTEFPFLIEMDRGALTEGEEGVATFKLDGLYYPMEIKYPEADERNLASGQEDVVYDYIYEYMNAVFTTLKTGEAVNVSFSATPLKFEDLVDEDSFLEYILVNEIMGNRDNSWGSIYFHKANGEKLTFGPVWDFDWSCASGFIGKPYEDAYIEGAGEFILIKPGNFHGDYLINQERYDKLVAKWNAVKANVQTVSNNLGTYYSYLKSVASIDSLYWYGNEGPYEFSTQYLLVRMTILDKSRFLDGVFSLDYETFKETYL